MSAKKKTGKRVNAPRTTGAAPAPKPGKAKPGAEKPANARRHARVAQSKVSSKAPLAMGRNGRAATGRRPVSTASAKALESPVAIPRGPMAPPKDHPPLGSHLSIAGSMVSALDEALRLGMDCVQVFTKNQRQWAVKEMPAEERDEWVRRCTELDWHATSAVPRVVSHNSYLINLASPDPEIRRKSIDLQRVEMERCEMLSIRYLVAHPGAHLTGERKPGEPNDLSGAINAAERAGLDRIVSALDELHAALPGYRVITCLETTVGSGTNLGYAFEHLAYVRGAVRESDRVGFCLDTCHVTAAGYDMTSEEKADGVMRHFDAICGLSNLYAVHLNDSEGAVGSRKDRHAHIGHGTCGASCFRAVLNHPQLRRVPMVLETEKEDDDRGEPWDLINLKALKALMRR